MGKTNITSLLKDYSQGNTKAGDELWPLVYDELHRLAKRYMSRERNAMTLQPTALVNEAFVKISGNKNSQISNREHFFAIAAKVMRQVLLDHAKAKRAEKRGGGGFAVEFDEKIHSEKISTDDISALDEALTRLENLDARLAQVVELRYYAGLSLEDIAQTLKLSLSTVKRDWNLAKAWLYREIRTEKKTGT